MDERIIETIDIGTDEQLMLSIDASGRIYVADEPAPEISALGGGIVALTTARRTVHIDAANYWRLQHDDVPPSLRDAGYLAAQLAHMRRHACELVELLDQEELLDNAYYPSIERVVAELRTALGEEISKQLITA
jgi:hypothetical protein